MNFKKGKGIMYKLFSVVVVCFILYLLIMSGPAQAFILGLSIDKPVVNKGEDVKFRAQLNIENSDSYLPVKELRLKLDGPVSKECVFDVSGKRISGCEHITLTPIDVSKNFGYGYGYGNLIGFGYGYGYGYNSGIGALNLTYDITLDSMGFLPGNYTTEISALIGQENFSSFGQIIDINSSYSASSSGIYNGSREMMDFSILSTVVDIKTTSDVTGKVSVRQYSSSPAGTFGIPSIGKFIEIDADQNVINNLDYATIKVYYLDSEVESFDESSLRLSYYNSETNSWEKFDGIYGGVDTVNNFVWARTNHFSLWGVFGNYKSITNEDSDSDHDSCETDWDCSSWTACQNGFQMRSCFKQERSCDAGDKPDEERTCTVKLTRNFVDESSTTSLTNVPKKKSSVSANELVIGSSLDLLLSAMIFLLLILMSFLVLVRLRRRK